MGIGQHQYMDVKCPFFVRWTTTSVTCEGVIPGARCTSQTFRNWLDMENYVRKNCCCTYETCIIYKVLMGKYV